MGVLLRLAKRLERALGEPDEKVVSVQKGDATPRDTHSPRGMSDRYGNDVQRLTAIERDRMSRYVDYENMDDYPEISSALDVYADDTCLPDAMRGGACLWPDTKDKMLGQVLEHLLSKRLFVEDEIWSLARTLAKYGNVFYELAVTKEGVIGWQQLPTPTMMRVEDTKGRLVGFLQDTSMRFDGMTEEKFEELLSNGPEGGLTAFRWYEVVHMRMRSKDGQSMYGYSVLDPARWAYKRLLLMEDASVVYKLSRAPSRNIFYVDVGNGTSAKEAMSLVEMARRGFRKTTVTNNEGRLDFKTNPWGPGDDLWLPTRGGKDSTRVEQLAGSDFQSLDDVAYFRDKLFAGIKVPKPYLGLSGEANKASLSQEDVRFARTVMRLQRAIIVGINDVSRIHLGALGIDPDAVAAYSFRMTVPSQVFELAQLEVMNARADLMSRLEAYYPKDWLLTTVMRHPKEEAESLKNDKQEEYGNESEFDASLERNAAANDLGNYDFTEPEPEPAQESSRRRSRPSRRPKEDFGNEMWGYLRGISAALKEIKTDLKRRPK